MLTQIEMLDAVRDRNGSFDGEFVYAVRTTGIYCQPSCSSRQANVENILFFQTSEEAKLKGFRACKRCRPDELGPSDPKAELARRICLILKNYLAAPEKGKPTLKMLAKELKLSEDHLSRSFRKVMGMGPLDYFDELRSQNFKKQLKESRTITEAAYGAGYGSSSRVYERAIKHLGMSPASYAKGGRGAEIAYTIVNCFLGRMLVGGTRQGVCAVYFGNNDGELVRELEQEFPKAEIGVELGELNHWAQVIATYLEKEGKVTLDIPLDMYGTAFQRLVWQELLKIAPGDVKTYQQIARQLGREKSSRAVGRACATNPVSLVVPCHRVMGSDGKLHGYRWGLERKAALMKWEEKISANSPSTV
ncbi:bifunctional transcriptional activator/DNA repair enzyme AdaA [Sneathiella glossodoripedis]|uniref:bifunctional transcriptional activator/DNA repair enzyme AdaA n=1 Tax=Sneathiella glossodoripedis TaxID=418853 RepID=UPI00055A1108|nr:methylated-DNA--[protein]-cysteine S-methyltransferase [Sneathiella glossodoripedis]